MLERAARFSCGRLTTRPLTIITRQGASRTMAAISDGNECRKPRRDSTGAPTTISSARWSVATSASSRPSAPARVRTKRSFASTPYARAISAACPTVLAKSRRLLLELCVQRQLLLDDQRRDEDDVGAAVGGEPAREVEGMLRLGAAEQGDDDAAIARPRPCGAQGAGRGAARPGPGRATRASAEQLVGNARENHVGLEEEQALDVERALIVQRDGASPRVTSSGISTSTVVSPSAVRSRR